MLTVLVILNVLAALLPLVAVLRVLVRARRSLARVDLLVQSRGHSHLTRDDVDRGGVEGVPDVRSALRETLAHASWDVGLIGVGLTAGAIANIWSLFL